MWSFLDFILILKRNNLEIAPDDPMRLDACLGVVSRIVDAIEILAENGELEIMQDTASCMTSSTGVFLRKVGLRPARDPRRSRSIGLPDLETCTKVFDNLPAPANSF